MYNFRQLNIWKDAIKLAKAIYGHTANFPAHEKIRFNFSNKSSSCFGCLQYR